MALTYDGTKVDKKVWNNERKRRVIIDLCWLFMVIKVNRITEEVVAATSDEFTYR